MKDYQCDRNRLLEGDTARLLYSNQIHRCSASPTAHFEKVYQIVEGCPRRRDVGVGLEGIIQQRRARDVGELTQTP